MFNQVLRALQERLVLGLRQVQSVKVAQHQLALIDSVMCLWPRVPF